MDNDLIRRSALLADIEDTVVISARNTKSAEMRGIHKVTDRIKAAPAVDAVEVVRCKDCIHYEKYPDYANECWHELGMINVCDDCYCSRGERRADDGRNSSVQSML